MLRASVKGALAPIYNKARLALCFVGFFCVYFLASFLSRGSTSLREALGICTQSRAIILCSVVNFSPAASPSRIERLSPVTVDIACSFS